MINIAENLFFDLLFNLILNTMKIRYRYNPTKYLHKLIFNLWHWLNYHVKWNKEISFKEFDENGFYWEQRKRITYFNTLKEYASNGIDLKLIKIEFYTD